MKILYENRLTFSASSFPKKDCLGKFLSELFVERDVDDWVDHGVHVGQHVDPEYVLLQDLWQLKGIRAVKMGGKKLQGVIKRYRTG